MPKNEDAVQRAAGDDAAVTAAGSGLPPPGLDHVRTTVTFDNTTVPPGLLRSHQVAAGVWGRLVVHSGAVRFVFEDDPDGPVTVLAGGALAIPPLRAHHVELDQPATFAVEFYTSPRASRPERGSQSSGLVAGSPERA